MYKIFNNLITETQSLYCVIGHSQIITECILTCSITWLCHIQIFFCAAKTAEQNDKFSDCKQQKPCSGVSENVNFFTFEMNKVFGNTYALWVSNKKSEKLPLPTNNFFNLFITRAQQFCIGIGTKQHYIIVIA